MIIVPFRYPSVISRSFTARHHSSSFSSLPSANASDTVPFAVMVFPQATTVAALLHDVVEDTPTTLEDLAEMGFDPAVLEALALLTHDDGTDYMDYVKAIKENPIAKAVKLADLAHNSDLSRLDEVDDKALARREKYQKAKNFLME